MKIRGNYFAPGPLTDTVKTFRSTAAVSILLLAAVPAKGQVRIDFEKYEPVSTLVVPGHHVSSAAFPFVDVHSHQRNMDADRLESLAQAMDTLNMRVMVNLSGGSGESLAQQTTAVKQHYPGRFLVFANIDFDGVGEKNWTENAVKQLEEDVRNGAAGLKIFKNLGFSVSDRDGRRVPVDDPRLDAIWEKCGELNIPVLIHTADPAPFWQEAGEQNERWLELITHPRRKRGANDPAPWEQLIEEQHRMFKKHPNTTFIAAHFGWYANDLKKLDSLLNAMPNVMIEFGAVIAELGRQPRMARQFFTKNQDRILFGKDSWVPEEYATYFRVLETEDEYFPYHKKYHAFWRMYGLGLEENILKKVYYKNALRVIPALDESLFPE
ncbi:putative TIM-barrel fold metal-dependent hydrolase [Anseongella ginsenosidimutans]|uniref:Putative TIM-barrel fold metal-dependent hydrolase n=1 Tax=Anseongella ginsenosidimutans TaxID=496056 RepID=A0A4R3KUC4_9SPHI|nr:amidohydrolase family protein [Anseongella ginsenosidimutans]QEC51659.1 amidohydrolase family protein [Anseongella ginsenosidimutans]TCS88997.1 putative TIM-barrel fold metal-dependent hydrolase [Anseongella ginsenosidimutans]